MTKLPDWFPLDVYQKDLNAMEWAFEIYIRLNLKAKVHFVAQNLPYSSSKQINIIYLLSHILPGFVFEEAVSIFEKEKEIFAQNKFEELKKLYGYQSDIFDEELREKASEFALNEGLSKYRNLGRVFDYAEYLALLPFHLILSGEDRLHLYEKFIEIHKRARAFPLFFQRNAPMETMESEEYFRENRISLPTDLKDGSTIFTLSDEHAIEHEQLLTIQPKAFTWGKKYCRGRYFTPNFAFSDGEILDAVAQYLKANRTAPAIGKSKILKQLPSWKEYQILALWDLTEWGEKWTNNKFTQPELADALWPYANRPKNNTVDYVDRLRKLSRRDLDRAMTEGVYSLLLDAGFAPIIGINS